MLNVKIPGWAFAGAAVAAGGALLYVYLRGSKGIARDTVGAAGGIVSGTIEGMGDAFQDVTQATFGVPKTNPDQCRADLNEGDTLGASFSCPAGTWLRSLFKADPVLVTKKPAGKVLTAPGGGVVESEFLSVLEETGEARCMPTFNNPAPCPVAGSEPDWFSNYAPASPLPVNSYGVTSLHPVAGLRG